MIKREMNEEMMAQVNGGKQLSQDEILELMTVNDIIESIFIATDRDGYRYSSYDGSHFIMKEF